MWPWASCAGLLDVLIWAAARATWRQRICEYLRYEVKSCLKLFECCCFSFWVWQGKCDHKKCKFCCGLSRCDCLYLFETLRFSFHQISLSKSNFFVENNVSPQIPRPLQSAAEPVRLKIHGPWQAVHHHHVYRLPTKSECQSW